MKHRKDAARYIPPGRGLEIGALHQPFEVPQWCTMEYLDVMEKDALRELFSELRDVPIIQPNYVGDIEKGSVFSITGKQYDIVVLSHVLEHVANPIQVIKNVWEAIAERGLLVIAIPDKNFTFDRSRTLTPYEHLVADYFRGVSEVSEEHYVDFLAHVHPEIFESKERCLSALQQVRKRREHVHVWDSQTFKDSLSKIFSLLGLQRRILYESDATGNQLEYLVVIEKYSESVNEKRALEILWRVYQWRPDLQQTFPIVQGRRLRKLVRWVLQSGLTVDSTREILSRYQSVYEGIDKTYMIRKEILLLWEAISDQKSRKS